MALEFPANPADGDVYPAAPNSEYVYNDAKGAWTSLPTESAKTITSDIPPVNAKDGDQWFNSIDGCLYIYYVDVDGGQWLQVKNDASFTSTLGPRVDALDANANTNYIINGAFDFWQRGNTFTSPANGAYCPDRWAFFQDGSGATKVVSRQSHTPGAAPVAGYEYNNYLKINQTVAGSGGTYNSFIQRVEDVRTLAGQTVTLSFWARTSSSSSFGTVYLLQNFGSGGSTSVGTNLTSSVALTSGWTRYTYTTTLPTLTGKTIGSSSYLEVGIYLPLNTTFNIDFFGAQLQAGSIATSFHRAAPTLAGELAACQRYFEKTYLYGDAPGALSYGGFKTFGGTTNASGALIGEVRFAVAKRAYPTMTGYSPSTGASGVSDYSRNGAGGTIGAYFDNVGEFGGRAYIASTGIGWGASIYEGHWTASAEL